MNETGAPVNGKEALLRAFDRLFEHAALKLQIQCTDEEKAKARNDFAERAAAALDVVEKIEVETIPDEVMQHMQASIDGLSPAQVVGYVATLPLVQQTHDMLRQIAFRAAEKRLLEQMIGQADDTYGGN